MSSKVQTMTSGLHDAARPRRFDLTMSRRTRRPTSLAAHCHPEDYAMEGFQSIQPQHQVQVSGLNAAPSQCLCLSDHLQSPHSEDAEAHKMSAQSEATEETDAQQQQECQDSSRRFSLQELIEDEAAVDGEKDAATGGHEEDPAAADAVVQGVAEAAAVGAEKPPEQVAGRRVIGMMRRYMRVRAIKTKHAPC
ncbi:hypothetical protein GQ55_3G484700 [Panicum hallii var. hallii]|uniref:Uncharacterized protein n=1 Tax=Panicum hallii var. hallii TaxID=1504633 RepID=A0A2T7EJR5_9POAL|nr:hypothetical protein GQ55_3G484700 [Panicum hallii var. hallii]